MRSSARWWFVVRLLYAALFAISHLGLKAHAATIFKGKGKSISKSINTKKARLGKIPAKKENTSKKHASQAKAHGKVRTSRTKPKQSRRLPIVMSSVTRAKIHRSTTIGGGAIQQKQLRTYSQSGTTEAMQSVPGLHLSQHGGRGKAQQFFLRGFDAVHGSELEIRLQDIPLNEASNIHGQGYADLGILMPLAMLRIRYLKGSFLGEQGDFAISGSLNVDLGLEERGLLIQATGGSFWRREVGLAWGPRSMGPESFVAAQFVQSQGFGQGRGFTEGRVMAQMQWKFRRFRLRFLLAGHFGDFENPGVLREADIQRGQMDFYAAQQEGLGGHSGRVLGQVKVLWQEGPNKLSVMFYAIGRDMKLIENFTGFLLSPQGDTFEQNHRFFQLGSVARYRRSWYGWGWRQKVTVGLEFRNDDIVQSQYRINLNGQRHTTEIDADLGLMQAAAWSTLRLRFSRRLFWTVSVRATLLGVNTHDIINDQSKKPHQGVGVQVAPRSILRYSLGSGWKAFAAYGLGYRSVQARSLHKDLFVPFQEAHTTELGVRLRKGRWLRASLATFAIYSAQELLFDHATVTNHAAGASWRVGGELQIQTQLIVPWLSLDGSVTYSRGWFTKTQLPVPFAPQLLVRSGLVANWKSKDAYWTFQAGLRVSFLGPRPLPLGFTSEPLLQMNAFARAQAGRFFLRIEGNHLLQQPWKDGQFVYTSAFEKHTEAQKLPQLHFSAGSPLQLMLTLGARFF